MVRATSNTKEWINANVIEQVPIRPTPVDLSGTVESVVAGDHITVDNTDPQNPVVAAIDYVESVVAGDRVTVDDTDPQNPIVSADAGTFPITHDNGSNVASIVRGSTSLTVEVDDNSSSYEASFAADVNEAGSLATAGLQAATPTHTGFLQMLIAEAASGPRVRLISNSDTSEWFVNNGDPNGGKTAAVAGAFCLDRSNRQVWIADITGNSNWHPLDQKRYLANAAATGTVTVNFKVARVHRLTMTGNITTLTLTAPLSGWAAKLRIYLVQDGTGTRLVTWPASVKWPAGVAPTLSAAANAVDIVELETVDGGSTWFGNLIGTAYA